MKFLWLLSLAILHILSGIDGHKLSLRYALFTAGHTGDFDSSDAAITAIELAEEMINADSSILPGYNLTHTAVLDSMCDRASSLNIYFNTISLEQPTILGLLGCGCSFASEAVAEIIHHNSISQISYASPSIGLSDRQRFPNFFRTFPSDADFPAAKLALIQKYGWNRVVLITQEESLFAETTKILMDTLTEANIKEIREKMGTSVELRRDLYNQDVDFFFEKEDFRVFFLNTDSKTARQIICEAYLRGFTYPKYAWLTSGRYRSNWWTEEVNPEPINCSDDQLAQFLHRSLAFEKAPEHKDLNAKTDIGLTPMSFDILYRERLSEEQRKHSFYSSSFVAMVAYDALWTFALALNKTNEMVQSLTRADILTMTQCKGTNERTGRQWDVVPLENFNYSNQLMGCIVRWNLERTDFVGVSGHIYFDDTGSRVHSEVKVYQYRLADDDNITRIGIAKIKRVNDTLSAFAYKNQSDQTVYPNSEGGVPPDGTPVSVIVTFHLALVGTYYILATAGLVLCTVCLIFNFTQRKKKVIRLNSPNLNYFIILGSYIMNVSIFFRVMPSTDLTVNAARCNLATLLNTIGYSMAYGAILAKMGRIYHIFHNPTINKKTLKDWHLALIVLAITAVGTALAVVQVAVPSMRPQPYHAQNEEPPSVPKNELGLRVKEEIVFCFNTRERPLTRAWIMVTFVYLAILQLIGIILAFSTRKVKVKALRDAKYIISVVYISAIALLTIAVSTFASGARPNIIELLFSGSLMVATTVFLCMVFIPKMVSLYKDPEGKNAIDKRQNSTINVPDIGLCKCTNISAFQATEQQTRVRDLELKVMELEKSLKEYQIRAAQSISPPNSTSTSTVESAASDMPLIQVSLSGSSDYRPIPSMMQQQVVLDNTAIEVTVHII